ncbi:hypothetical protein R3I94_018830 [Phoxinus phoxinus]|uniref:Uncharacterized protein n=1 Tax=Phoxinus phoxinus TaxID=58324 RepID=A0AAN9GZM9_9TELE
MALSVRQIHVGLPTRFAGTKWKDRGGTRIINANYESVYRTPARGSSQSPRHQITPLIRTQNGSMSGISEAVSKSMSSYWPQTKRDKYNRNKVKMEWLPCCCAGIRHGLFIR